MRPGHLSVAAPESLVQAEEGPVAEDPPARAGVVRVAMGVWPAKEVWRARALPEARRDRVVAALVAKGAMGLTPAARVGPELAAEPAVPPILAKALEAKPCPAGGSALRRPLRS